MNKAETEDAVSSAKAPPLPDYVLLPLKLAGVDDPRHLRFYTEAEIERFMEEEGMTFRTPGCSVFDKFTPSVIAKLKKACIQHESHFFAMDPEELESIIGDSSELEVVHRILAEEKIELGHGHSDEEGKKRSRRARGGRSSRKSRDTRIIQ
jgi:hypothetical protein